MVYFSKELVTFLPFFRCPRQEVNHLVFGKSAFKLKFWAAGSIGEMKTMESSNQHNGKIAISWEPDAAEMIREKMAKSQATNTTTEPQPPFLVGLVGVPGG